MPNDQVLIGDVWKPSQADDFLKVIKFKDDLEQAKLRNRIAADGMGKADWEQKQRESTIQAAGGEQAYLQQQQEIQRRTQMKAQMDQDMGIIENFQQVLGIEGLKKNWEQVDSLLSPALKGKLSAENFTKDGYAAPVKDETGEIIGHNVYGKKGAAPHFQPATKDPTQGDTIVREGYAREYLESHPKVSKREALFYAEKKQRKEKQT